MTIDIGHNCIECHEDTKFGSGRFVNRIPADNEKYSGYLCVDCQSENCDECNTLTHEYFLDDDSDVLCEDCYVNKVKMGLTSDHYDILEEEGV
jgi:hypothetical protein